MSTSRNHQYHYIYRTVCVITNRYYIGMHSTSNLNDGYLGSGRRLWLSINKYGKLNHHIEILEWLPDRASLKAREFELVNEELLADPMCMNLQVGGGGGFLNIEHQLKCSAAGGKTNPVDKVEKAKARMSKENLKRLTEGSHKSWKENYSWLGKSHTLETRDKIGYANSINQIGEKNSQFGTKWVVHPITGPIKVKSQEVDDYLKNGYSVGRTLSDK